MPIMIERTGILGMFCKDWKSADFISFQVLDLDVELMMINDNWLLINDWAHFKKGAYFESSMTSVVMLSET